MKYRAYLETKTPKLADTDSLYSACRAIAGKKDGIVIANQNRLVAFWSSWHNAVRAGNGATDDERQSILDYRMDSSFVATI